MVDGEVVELAQQPLAHDDRGGIAKPRGVRDEADDALAGLLSDATLGDTEEPEVEVVEQGSETRRPPSCRPGVLMDEPAEAVAAANRGPVLRAERNGLRRGLGRPQP
jgi:hypothetical protein